MFKRGREQNSSKSMENETKQIASTPVSVQIEPKRSLDASDKPKKKKFMKQCIIKHNRSEIKNTQPVIGQRHTPKRKITPEQTHIETSRDGWIKRARKRFPTDEISKFIDMEPSPKEPTPKEPNA